MPNEPIDTLYVDLVARTDGLLARCEEASKKAEEILTTGFKKTRLSTEEEFKLIGTIIKTSLGSAFSELNKSGNIFSAINEGTKTLNTGLVAAAGAGSQMAGVFADIVGTFSVWIGVITSVVGGLGSVVNFLKQIGEEGLQTAARLDSLKVGLEVISKNAGQNVDFVRSKVADLQRTGITTTEAIESIMQFLSNKLPIENIEKLARAGQDMAVAYGRNSSETFNRFVYAILTGNAEILRAVGIQQTASQMQEKYAATIGKTAEQLTQVEKRQAIINGILQQASGFTGLYEHSLESLGKRIGSLPRYIEEGKAAFGQALLPVLDMSITAAEKFWKEFRKLFVEIENGASVLDSEGNPKLTKFGQMIFDIAAGIRDQGIPLVILLTSNLQTLANTISGLILTFSAYAGSVKAFWGAFVPPAALKGIFDFLNSGVVAFGQALALSASGVGAFFKFVELSFSNLGKLMRGEAMQTFDEIKAAAIATGDEILRAFVGIKEQTPAATTTAGPLPFPSEGEEDDQKQKKKLASLAISLADAIDEGQKRVQESQSKFVEAMDEFNQQVVAKMSDLSEQLSKEISKVKERTAKEEIKLKKSLDEDLQKIDERTNESIAAKQKDNEERRVKSKEDFLLRMKRMEEDYNLNLLDAVQNRDAKQVLQLMRQHAIEVSRANEDRRRKETEDQESEQHDIERIRQNAERAKQEAIKNYNDRLADLRQSEKERIAELQSNYRQEMAALIVATEKRHAELLKSHEKEMAALQAANKERIATLVSHWADQEDVNEAGAKKVLNSIDRIYGAGGQISKLIDGFIARMKRNGQITISINSEQSGDLWGSSLEDMYANQYGGVPIPQATGGLIVANKPTNILIGEGGPEASLQVPMNSVTSLSQLASGISGGSSNKLEVEVKVSADSHFSEEAEDKLFDRLADTLAPLIPKASIRRG